MTDSDRILASIEAQTKGRILPSACDSCAFSLNYCRCVTHLDGPAARCCSACTHGAGE